MTKEPYEFCIDLNNPRSATQGLSWALIICRFQIFQTDIVIINYRACKLLTTGTYYMIVNETLILNIKIYRLSIDDNDYVEVMTIPSLKY